MSVFDTARVLSYGIMVPVLIYTGFLIYRRNQALALFFTLQGCIYLVQLSLLVIWPYHTHAPGGEDEAWEPVYTTFLLAQVVAVAGVVRFELVARRKLRSILYDTSNERFFQEEKLMPKFQIPGVLPVALILLLPPAIIPVIQQFFPTNTYWWSALIVVILNTIVLVVRVSWPTESSKVPVPASATAPEGEYVSPVQERSTISKILLGA